MSSNKPSKADRLRDHYRSILASVGIQEDSGGHGELSICLDSSQDPVPLTVTDEGVTRRVVIPTQAYLKEGNWEDYHPFHPLCEHVMRGESQTIKLLKRLVLFRLRATLSDLVNNLLYIAANEDEHKHLAPQTSRHLTEYGLDQVEDKTLKRALKLSKEAMDHYVNIYLQPFGQFDEVEYKRLACVAFPLYKAMTESDEKKVCGVDLGSKRAKNQIQAALEAALPGIESPENFYFGSDKQVAPNFHALMGAYAQIAKVLNKVIHKFRKHIPHYKELVIDTSWIEELHQIEQFKSAIPALPGNEGAVVEQEEQETTEQASGGWASALGQANQLDVSGGRAKEQTPAQPQKAAQAAQPPVDTTLGGGSMSQPAASQSPAQPPQQGDQGRQKMSWKQWRQQMEQPRNPAGVPTGWNQPAQPPQQPMYGQPAGGGYGFQNPAGTANQGGSPFGPQPQMNMGGQPPWAGSQPGWGGGMPNQGGGMPGQGGPPPGFGGSPGFGGNANPWANQGPPMGGNFGNQPGGPGGFGAGNI